MVGLGVRVVVGVGMGRRPVGLMIGVWSICRKAIVMRMIRGRMEVGFKVFSGVWGFRVELVVILV